ncbi:MAG: HDOD domain-containing protein [Pirellulales bacterium]|nr:HDOD domain-containing protein [Pirellulales bacterium]
MAKRILFVDDQANVLEGLRRLLHPYRHEWEMVFVESGAEALRQLEASPFDVLVTDMRMPGMNGSELLQLVQQRYPQVVRMVLSGHADLIQAERALGTAHQYLSKPCDTQTLRATLVRACAVKERLADPNLRRLVGQMASLPSRPDLFGELVRELESEDASIQRIGELIGRDVAMTAKLLQIVNSSFFGLPRRVESPAQAACFLGLNILRPVVLSSGIFSRLSTPLPAGYTIEMLTEHSLAVSRLAERMARSLTSERQLANDALMAGMVHDVGQLVLASGVPEGFEEALGEARREGVPLHVAERQVLGTDHAAVGAYLLALWGLPASVVEAAAYHHDPAAAGDPALGTLALVHLANVLVKQRMGPDWMRGHEEADREWLGRAGVSEQQMSQWAELADKLVLQESPA